MSMKEGEVEVEDERRRREKKKPRRKRNRPRQSKVSKSTMRAGCTGNKRPKIAKTGGGEGADLAVSVVCRFALFALSYPPPCPAKIESQLDAGTKQTTQTHSASHPRSDMSVQRHPDLIHEERRS